MDYAAWTNRASQFLRRLTRLPGDVSVSDSIEAAATDDHTVNWLEAGECSLPAVLREFIATGSKRCCFTYAWRPPEALQSLFAEFFPRPAEVTGGADLCEAARFHVYDSRGWFASMAEEVSPIFGMLGAGANEPERERGRVDILTLREGERISVVLTEGEAGEVAYVWAGDGDRVQVISRSFDEFLENWERIGYVAPSFENLRPWLDAETGLLAPDEAKAGRLRALFKGATEPGAKGAPGELRAWLGRAEAFVRGLNFLEGKWGVGVFVEAPISNEQADQLAAELPLGLPAPLRRLYVEGAGSFDCTFHWTPRKDVLPKTEEVFPHQHSLYGGARFIGWEHLAQAHEVREWWDGWDGPTTAEQERARKIWRQTVPFIHVGNGDYVGLHVTGKEGEYPVVYLCHDDEEGPVTPISPSLEEFLKEWEKVCYAGPEIWLLHHFLEGGSLSGDGERARKWREIMLPR